MIRSINHKRSRAVLAGALAAGLSLAAGPAAAATFYINGADGHLFLSSGEAVWKDQYTDSSGGTLVRVVDGRKIKLVTPDGIVPMGTRTWVIHIPINDTNANWNVAGRGGGGSGTASQNGHRICSFTSSGNFSGCGAQVTLTETSTVLVPSSGTAFSQSTFSTWCSQPGLCHPSQTLSSIKANN